MSVTSTVIRCLSFDEFFWNRFKEMDRDVALIIDGKQIKAVITEEL